MIRIARKEISLDDEIGRLKSPECGALCIFLGTVRREKGLKTIEIESYNDMAKRKLSQIEGKALQKYKVEKIRIIHRIGSLDVGNAILFIGVSAPHRKAAFGACRYILEEIKKGVPIWKKEVFSHGERWVI